MVAIVSALRESCNFLARGGGNGCQGNLTDAVLQSSSWSCSYTAYSPGFYTVCTSATFPGIWQCYSMQSVANGTFTELTLCARPPYLLFSLLIDPCRVNHHISRSQLLEMGCCWPNHHPYRYILRVRLRPLRWTKRPQCRTKRPQCRISHFA